MVNYREIIRLKCLEYDNSRVSHSCGCSRNMVAEVWQLAMEKDLGWPIPDAFTSKDLQQILYPDRIGMGSRKLPDYEYVHKELSKPGVTLSLLWA